MVHSVRALGKAVCELPVHGGLPFPPGRQTQQTNYLIKPVKQMYN